jgi:hypothetical protein
MANKEAVEFGDAWPVDSLLINSSFFQGSFHILKGHFICFQRITPDKCFHFPRILPYFKGQQSQRPFKKQRILTTYDRVEENLQNFPV